MALEFALVATAFLGLLLFCFGLGFRLYAQIAVDYAASRAARLLEVDSMHNLPPSSASFRDASLCQFLSPLLACQNIVISLYPIGTDYKTDAINNPPTTSGTLSPTPTFNPGQSQSLMLLRVTYVAPPLGWPLTAGPTVTLNNGVTGSAIVTQVPFRNEY